MSLLTAEAGDRIVDGAYQAFPDPISNRMFTVLMAVATEVWTTRDRVRVLENALQRHGIPVEELLDENRDTEEALAAMRRDRDAFVERILGSLAAEQS